MANITFKDNTERETLRLAFDTAGLPMDTTDVEKTANHILIGRDDKRQEYLVFSDKKLATFFNNLGDERSTKYVPIESVPKRYLPSNDHN